MFEGSLKPTDTLHMFATRVDLKPVEIGVFAPGMKPVLSLTAGDVGYVATGLKTLHDCRVWRHHDAGLCAGPPSPCRAIAIRSRWSLPASIRWKQRLPRTRAILSINCSYNDASLIFDPETSQALGFGFRAGFLGLFHMEIIQERIEREYAGCAFHGAIRGIRGGFDRWETELVDSPAELPDESKIVEIREPWMTIEIITPTEYYGPIMELVTGRRGIY